LDDDSMRWHYEMRMRQQAEARRAAWLHADPAQRATHMREAELRAIEEQEREGVRRMAVGERASMTSADIVIHQRIEFRNGSAVVEDVNVPALVCVAQLMLEQPLLKVGVCASPSDGLVLGSERAENVCKWLMEQGGVSVSRLRVGSTRREALENDEAATAVDDSPTMTADDDASWHLRFHVIPEIKIWDKIHFECDSTGLKQASLPTLDAVARVCKERGVGRLTIEGHCCIESEEQTDAANLDELSTGRAAAVRRYLTDEAGVSLGARMPSVVGHSTRRPCAPCDSKANRSRNRRVEFLVW